MNEPRDSGQREREKECECDHEWHVLFLLHMERLLYDDVSCVQCTLMAKNPVNFQSWFLKMKGIRAGQDESRIWGSVFTKSTANQM